MKYLVEELKYMVKDNNYYINKTIEEIDKIISYSSNMTVEDLYNHPAVLDGIIFRMIQMSEHMNNISDDFKLVHNEIKWSDIKGFRNRLVHNYGNVNLNFVFTAITIDIPKLKVDLKKILGI